MAATIFDVFFYMKESGAACGLLQTASAQVDRQGSKNVPEARRNVMGPDQNFNAKAFDYYPELNRVRRHFETNHSEPMSLSDAAKIAGLEAKHFGKFFTQKVGIGFKHWSTLIRIQKAINLMHQEHRPLTDIAFAIGFHDYGTFERAFKKHTGITPSEFKKTIQT